MLSRDKYWSVNDVSLMAVWLDHSLYKYIIRCCETSFDSSDKDLHRQVKNILFYCLCCSFERNVIITANDTAEPPTVSPPSAPLHQNETWPTASGINETEARRICQSPILQSPIFSLCQNFTVDSLEFISESCMLDLLVWRQDLSLFMVVSRLLHLMKEYL